MKERWVIFITFTGVDIKERFYGTYEELSKEVDKLISDAYCRYGEPKTILITVDSYVKESEK